jgi:hypothetical protein
MFGYSPFYGGNNNAYYRALAEEEAARKQYAAARAAEGQAQRRAQQQALFDRLYGDSYYNDDDDDSYYGGYPHGDSYYRTPRTTREQAYREALLERAKQEEARRAALERERELEQLRVQELRRRQQQQLAEEEHRKRELLARQRQQAELERQRQLELEQQRRRRRSLEEDDSRMDELERFYRMMGLPVPQRQPRSQEPSTGRTTRIPVSGGRAQTQPPVDRTPAPTTPPPVPAKPTYTAEHATAASKIQDAYRAHAARRHALSELSNISNSFSSLQAGFHPPEHLDYIVEGATVDVPTTSVPLSTASEGSRNDETSSRPKLAYTSKNAPLHAYEDALGKLLSKIDAVESGGDADVRAARKALARAVEADAERVEAWRSRVWEAYVESTKTGADAPAQDAEMNVEPKEADLIVPDSTPAEVPTLDLQPTSVEETVPQSTGLQPADAILPPSEQPVSSPGDDFVVVDTPSTPQPDSQAIALDDVSSVSLAPAPSSPALMPAAPSTDPMDVFVDAMTSPTQPNQPTFVPDTQLASDVFGTDPVRPPTPLPLTSVLSTAHPAGVDTAVAVSEDAQLLADDASHAEGAQDAHRGVAAPLENTSRLPDGIEAASEQNASDRQRERDRQSELEAAEGKENDQSAVDA